MRRAVLLEAMRRRRRRSMGECRRLERCAAQSWVAKRHRTTEREKKTEGNQREREREREAMRVTVREQSERWPRARLALSAHLSVNRANCYVAPSRRPRPVSRSAENHLGFDACCCRPCWWLGFFVSVCGSSQTRAQHGVNPRPSRLWWCTKLKRTVAHFSVAAARQRQPTRLAVLALIRTAHARTHTPQ